MKKQYVIVFRLQRLTRRTSIQIQPSEIFDKFAVFFIPAENVTYPEIPRSYWRIETGTESPASGDHFPFLITLNFHQKGRH